MSKTLTTIFLLTLSSIATAQEWMQLHHHYAEADWTMPIRLEDNLKAEATTDNTTLTIVSPTAAGEGSIRVSLATLDSIDFAPALSDDQKGHNRYRPFAMYITTEDETPITERDTWLRCHISIDGRGEYSNYSGTAQIRGRGNSSWLWYDKKPYKFKLDEKSKLLGLSKAKNWNLLANYRDVTDLMNTFAFETARWMGMPYTNHTRYVEVFLNQEYIGLYQLTEKIELKNNRIEIDEQQGLLLSFDQDDGPSLAPDDGDNFWSEVYRLPMCVKQPEGLSPEQLDSIRRDFAQLETAVKSHNYALADSLMDIGSFISILQLHEFLYNVEIDAPRSLYMFRAPGGKYTFGPVWDWDAGFDFDWTNMYTGHTYFGDYTELIYGTDPLTAKGAAYNINKFWRDLFGNAQFVNRYKDTWATLSDSILEHNWTETLRYADALRTAGAYDRDTERWPLTETSGGGWWWGPTTTTTFRPDDEIRKMGQWLSDRKNYLDTVIANYPAGNDEIIDTQVTLAGTITLEQPVNFSSGYNQTGQIAVSRTQVATLLGGTPTDLVPLNADGTEGSNTAAGTYGAWFDTDGNTAPWADGHIYIESNSLYNWAYGCHPDNCWPGDTHTVTMQYRRNSKAVNVVVTFTVE
jgi:hypothetical protein